VATPYPQGSFPALITPLTPEREVDEHGVAALVERALADGASGVLVAGSTGEGALLDAAQRVQLVRRARTTIDGLTARVPLLAGACGLDVAALCADVDRLAGAGCDRVLVLAPHTYGLTPAELADVHLEVAERAGVPTLIYHIPQLTNSELTPEVVGALAEHPNIVGMKDSSPDAERRAAFVAAASGVDDFAVLTGHAPTLKAALEAGVHGSITAVANIRQWQVVALHRAVEVGDTARAERLQDGLTRTSEAIGAVGASVPAVLKAARQLDGVIAERWCRPPLRSVDPGRLDHVRTALMA
jgi:4-hydroxy-tetrahydrodipicolinate synthase